MTTVKFNFKGNMTQIQSKSNEKMSEIINRFLIKSQAVKSNCFFIYKGSNINEELELSKIVDDKDKNEICILVNEIENDEKKKDLKNSKHVICPECYESSYINIDDYKINILGCKNNHIRKDLLLEQFENSQKIDESGIVCNICRTNNKSETYENIFYFCLKCKSNICPICKSKHDKKHNIINYDQKYFICNNHSDNYSKYCKECNENICALCEKTHKNHNSIYLSEFIIDKEEMANEMDKLKENIDNLKDNIKNIIKMLNSVLEKYDLYYKIANDIIDNYEIQNKNYYVLQTINEIKNYNNDIINDIKNITNEENIKIKLKNILRIYNKMNNIEDKSEAEELLKEYNNKINYKFMKDPKNLSYKLDISKTNDSIGVNDIFEVFISFKDCNEYLISPNSENYNLEVYLLKNNQIIKSLVGHKNNILSIRYFLNNKDYNEYLISSDDNRTVIVWHITKNYKLLHNIDTKYSGVSYGCFLAFPPNTDKSFILTSTKHYSYDDEKSATKIFSLNDGQFIKYIKDSNNYQVIYLLSWINKNNNKYYIIQVANFYILINDLFEDELYAILSNDINNDFHDTGFIYNKNKIDYLCTCTENGFIHIWDLDHKNLFQKIQLGCWLITIIDWNDQYSIVCDGENNNFIIIDMKTFAITGKINSNHNNELICIKKILHPTFGESLLTAGRDKVLNLFS